MTVTLMVSITVNLGLVIDEPSANQHAEDDSNNSMTEIYETDSTLFSVTESERVPKKCSQRSSQKAAFLPTATTAIAIWWPQDRMQVYGTDGGF